MDGKTNAAMGRVPTEHAAACAAEVSRLERIATERETYASQLEMQTSPEFRYATEVARRARAAAVVAAAVVAVHPPKVPPRPKSIVRVDCAHLSLARFRRTFVATATPVVITGLNYALTEDGEAGAACDWMRRRAETKLVAVTNNHAHAAASVSLADTTIIPLGAHLQSVLDDAAARDELWEKVEDERNLLGTYVYDCSVPLKLPSLMPSLRVPRYFAHDYLQRTMRLHAFSKSWPSLFVASHGASSSLHVDQWCGNFWMAQVQGVKRWCLFHPDDIAFLSPDYSRGTLDPSFAPLKAQEDEHKECEDDEEGDEEVEGDDEGGEEGEREKERGMDTREENTRGDGTESKDTGAAGTGRQNTSASPSPSPSPRAKHHPFFLLAREWDVDLAPGEVLFVPGGWPHHVRNIGATVAFAGNFIDDSNLQRALFDLELQCAKQGGAMIDTFNGA